MPEAPLELC